MIIFAERDKDKTVENKEQSPQEEEIDFDDPVQEPTKEIVHSSKYISEFENLDTGIPLVVLNSSTPLLEISKDGWTETSFDLICSNRDDVVVESAYIKGRGNSSWSMDKKPYTIKLEEKQNLLGMGNSRKWVLIANHSDKSLVRNTYASYVGRKIISNQNWNPKIKNVDVIYNGEYIGNYTLSEQVRIEGGRIDVQEFSETRNGLGLDVNGDGTVDINDGGFLIEIQWPGRLEQGEVSWKSGKGVNFNLKSPSADDVPEVNSRYSAEYKYIQDIFNEAENKVYSDSNWENYIDVDSFVDWLLVNEFLRNTDPMCWQTSCFMYYDPSSKKLCMAPNWDFDIAMGNYGEWDCEKYDRWSGTSYDGAADANWFRKLIKIPEFKNRVIERWNEIKVALKESFGKIQELAELNSKSAQKNFERWPILGTYVWPNVEGYENRLTYQSEVVCLSDWLEKRYNWFDSNINNIVFN